MAQQYIYNSDYVNRVNEEIYREISSLHEQCSERGINPNKNDDIIVHNNASYGSLPVKNVGTGNATDGRLNLITGFGAVILTLLVVYFCSRMVFWLIVISLCILCFSSVTRGLGCIKAGEKGLPL